MTSRPPTGDDGARIESLERRLEALDGRVRNDVGDLYAKIGDLHDHVDGQLAPILARQHQLVGVSGVISLIVGVVLTKLVEIALALLPPPHH